MLSEFLVSMEGLISMPCHTHIVEPKKAHRKVAKASDPSGWRLRSGGMTATLGIPILQP